MILDARDIDMQVEKTVTTFNGVFDLIDDMYESQNVFLKDIKNSTEKQKIEELKNKIRNSL